MKSFAYIKSAVLKMLLDNHSPRQIALGVAIGAFIAILPLYGFHTILCVIAFFLVPGVNRLAILLGTNVSLPPTVATITWTAYDIGRFILVKRDYPPLSWEFFKHLNLETIKELYYPLFVGSIVLGLLTAIVLYYVTLIIAEKMSKRHK